MRTAEAPRTRSIALFDALSGVYDTSFVQALVYRPTQDQVLDQLRRIAPRRILDIGCGTGQLTARLHEELGAVEVYGCDAAEGMLAQAGQRSNSVTWLLGTAEAVDLPDGSLDAIVCTEAFHWFDQYRALAEFHRLLAPGGHAVLAFVSPYTRLGSKALDYSPLMATGGHWPDRRSMRRLATASGFRVVRQQRVDRTFGRLIPTVISDLARL